MHSFIAIDFETANGSPSSVCSVGVVMIKDGLRADSYYSLIHPYPNYYAWYCQKVHGLGLQDTDDAPCFPEVWREVEERICMVFEDHWPPFVAHNAHFDAGCLRSVLQAYRLPCPDFLFLDTLQASRRHFGKALPNHQLQTVAQACGYDLSHHHHALADAEACAAIALHLAQDLFP